VCESVAVVTPNNDQNSFRLSVEHPSGEFTVNLETEMSGNQLQIKKAGVIRTARMLAKGELFISAD
jgi:4-oxalomesaconate tautomerase